MDYVAYYDFTSLTVFAWMPDMSFALLGAECVCNPGNPLELFSGTVKLLETVQSCWNLLMRFS